MALKSRRCGWSPLQIDARLISDQATIAVKAAFGAAVTCSQVVTRSSERRIQKNETITRKGNDFEGECSKSESRGGAAEGYRKLLYGHTTSDKHRDRAPPARRLRGTTQQRLMDCAFFLGDEKKLKTDAHQGWHSRKTLLLQCSYVDAEHEGFCKFERRISQGIPQARTAMYKARSIKRRSCRKAHKEIDTEREQKG